jgi:AcrR family transcriptional regulator
MSTTAPVPADRPSTLTASGEARRAEIIEAAAALFDEFGFHRTSTAAIADRVGAAKATVYHYFKTKDEILYAIHDAWIEGLLSVYQKRADQEPDSMERLHAVFRDVLFLMHTQPGHVRVFFEYFRELPPDLQRAARVKRDRYEGLVESSVLAGMRDGEIRWQDPRVATFALFGMCNWTYQWYRPGGRLGHAEIADQLFRIWVSGVRVPPPLPDSLPDSRPDSLPGAGS